MNRDLEASVEELQNDVKSKQCYVTMNDVESFALVLSTISRSLVDLKGKYTQTCMHAVDLGRFHSSLL